MSNRGLNKVQIIGNIGNSIDVKVANSGIAIVNLSVATSETWTDKQTGEKREVTEWHRIVMFGKLSEIAGKYLRKGSQIYVEGKLRTRKWTDSNNIERYTTEIVADEMQMLGSKPSDFEPQVQAPQAQAQAQAPQAQAQAQAQAPQANTPDEVSEKDIPF